MRSIIITVISVILGGCASDPGIRDSLVGTYVATKRVGAMLNRDSVVIAKIDDSICQILLYRSLTNARNVTADYENRLVFNYYGVISRRDRTINIGEPEVYYVRGRKHVRNPNQRKVCEIELHRENFRDLNLATTTDSNARFWIVYNVTDSLFTIPKLSAHKFMIKP